MKEVDFNLRYYGLKLDVLNYVLFVKFFDVVVVQTKKWCSWNIFITANIQSRFYIFWQNDTWICLIPLLIDDNKQSTKRIKGLIQWALVHLGPTNFRQSTKNIQRLTQWSLVPLGKILLYNPTKGEIFRDFYESITPTKAKIICGVYYYLTPTKRKIFCDIHKSRTPTKGK